MYYVTTDTTTYISKGIVSKEEALELAKQTARRSKRGVAFLFKKEAEISVKVEADVKFVDE